MAPVSKEAEEAMASKESKADPQKLAALYEGDCYARRGDYQHALEAYKRAGYEEGLLALGNLCIMRGETTHAIAAFEAAGKKISERELKTCGDAALRDGRVGDALEAYKRAKLIWAEEPSSVLNRRIERGQFAQCAEICIARGRRFLEKGSEREAKQMFDDAAFAYVIARTPHKIVELGDFFLQKSQSDPDRKIAREFYGRAARLAVDIEEVEGKGMLMSDPDGVLMKDAADHALFISEDLTRAAKKAAEFEQDAPFAPAGKSKKRDEKK